MEKFARILHELTRKLSDSQSLAVALLACVRAARSLASVDCAGIYLVDDAGSKRTDTLPERTRRELETVASQIGAVLTRFRAEEALGASRARYRLLLDSITDAVFSIDDEARLELVNSTAARLLGAPRSDIVGAPVATVMARSSLRDAWPDLEELFQPSLACSRVVEVTVPASPRTTYEVRAYPASPGVLFLCKDVSERRLMVETQNQYRRDLQTMATDLSMAEDRLRRRISVELHDRIGQQLLGAKLKLGLALADNDPETRHQVVTEAMALLTHSMRDVSSLSQELYPPAIFELGLPEALQWLSKQFSRQFGIACELRGRDHTSPSNETLSRFAFQATRELLTNVAKHTRASAVAIELTSNDTELEIAVRDDGPGFGEAPADRDRGGFGLFALRERLRHLGGRMEIESDEEAGSCVRFAFPLSSSFAGGY